jgi:Protein of unknown function (DUF1064).
MAYRGWRRNGTKYNATKVTIDGHTFDSKKESNRYLELKLLERGKVISDLRTQVEFELLPNQYITEKRYGKSGKPLKDKKVLLERRVVYRADFVYTLNETGETVVEDVKGIRLPEYILKRKMFLYKYGIPIHEI